MRTEENGGCRVLPADFPAVLEIAQIRFGSLIRTEILLVLSIKLGPFIKQSALSPQCANDG